MILKLKETADLIAEFIKSHVEKSAGKTAIIGISGGVDSALVAALCKRAGVNAVGVIMGCHSSPSSRNRAYELLEKLDMEFMDIPLDEAHEVIAKTRFNSIKINKEVKNGFLNLAKGKFDYPALNLPKATIDFANQSLRSCLRAPTLDYVGKLYKGIIVGTGNRDEDEVTRYFQKRGDGCVDLSPIAKLHKSEVYQLAAYLEVPKSILDAVPSADLMGPDAGHEDEKELGMTYNEIETAMRLVENYLRSKNPPMNTFIISNGVYTNHRNVADTSLRAEDFRETAKHGNIASPRMLKVLLTLADMEENSRHKENPNLPVCNPRKVDGLIL